MKNLITVLLCTIIGFSAYAGNSVPKKALPTLKKEITTSNKPFVNNQFRRSSCFIFHDSCGQTVTIYVSGPNSTTEYQLWLVAYKDFEQHVYADGCY